MEKESIVSQLFSIKKMWSATILKWIYRIGLVVFPLVEIILSFYGGFLGFLGTLLFIIPLTILFWRIFIEAGFVIFGIFDKLSSIEAIAKNKEKESN